MKLNAHLLVNVIALKVGWVACVVGGAKGAPLAGVAAVAVAVALHLGFAANAAREARLLAAVAVVGLTWDSALVATGLMSYPSGTLLPGFAPYWIVAMWVLFATGLNVSLDWLKRRTAVAATLGAVGGPLAYLAGYNLGGVVIPDLALGLAVQGVGWALIMPLLTRIAAVFDGVSDTVRTPATA